MTRSLHRLALLAVAAALVGACSTTGGRPGTTAPTTRPSTPPASSGSGAAGSLAAGGCPTSQPPALAAGEKRIVTIETVKGTLAITVEADLAPLTAGNFVALAECGFYKGVVFHRLVPGFVIQGGDPSGTGSGGPGYEFADEPVKGDYVRGAVAMANSGPNTNGSQFFICLDDLTGRLDKNYSLFGHVTSGLEAVDGIAAMPNSGPPGNAAVDPVAMDNVTVSTP
jgi:cyclophilin family peptidyl-prolyl cis-trans isomerase